MRAAQAHRALLLPPQALTPQPSITALMRSGMPPACWRTSYLRWSACWRSAACRTMCQSRTEKRKDRTMTKHRIMGHNELRDEMIAVARGKKKAPTDAHEQSFEFVEALMRLLTPENRELLAIIGDRKPQSIAELAQFSGRAAPNLTRTLSKLEPVGFVRFQEPLRRRMGDGRLPQGRDLLCPKREGEIAPLSRPAAAGERDRLCHA